MVAQQSSIVENHGGEPDASDGRPRRTPSSRR